MMCFTLGIVLLISFAIMSITNTRNYYYEIEDEDFCFDDDEIKNDEVWVVYTKDEE